MKIAGCKDIAKKITETTGVPCSERTVREFIKRENLPVKRWGTWVTIESDALQKWIVARYR